MKQLERLLFLQGNRCYFCQQPIPMGEASVEHLVATANGGPKDDENCVACCKAVNAALGSLSFKAKLQVILNQRGAFQCPHVHASPGVEVRAEPPVEPQDENLSLVLADLQKRGAARPRRVPTLRNTINAAFHMKLSEDHVSSILGQLQNKGYVIIQDAKVTYALPQRDA